MVSFLAEEMLNDGIARPTRTRASPGDAVWKREGGKMMKKTPVPVQIDTKSSVYVCPKCWLLEKRKGIARNNGGDFQKF